MLVTLLEQVRTERGANASKRYRYQRMCLLRCEICGKERRVQYTKQVRLKTEHPCKLCKTKQIGCLNKGKPSCNKGKRLTPAEQIKRGGLYANSSGYLEVYLGAGHKNTRRRDKYALLHRIIAELKIKRTLKRQKRVHHIDGNKQNNSPDNLYICSSNSSHRDVHTNLENISFKLVQYGIIEFDHTTGTYYLPHLEEILDAYSVNSEKTYVLSIDSEGCSWLRSISNRCVDNLGNMAILNQADKLSEGATIIPLGSRVQENSKRGES